MYKKLFFFKCSTCSIGTSRSYYGQSAVLELFIHKNKQKLAAIAHPGPRGGESRQKPIKMSEICLPTRLKSVRAEAKVDKNRSKCLNLFYHPPKKNMHKKAAAPTLRLLKIIYFSTQPPSIGTFAP